MQLSKFLSYVLRHNPQAIGITLDANGWANIDQLIAAARAQSMEFTPEIISRIVSEDRKQRYRISEDGKFIRANQGHSIDVDLQLEPRQPPAVLFHGTANRFLSSIMQHGVLAQNRRYVHCSSNVKDAYSVGMRHGKPVILRIDAAAMWSEDMAFYLSENGIWLTQWIPAKYLAIEVDKHE